MKIVQPRYALENKGHYSPAIAAGGLLFVSGQLSRNPDTGTVAEGGWTEHAELALANVDRVLREAGCSREDIVQLRIFIAGGEGWDPVNEACAGFFGPHKPARIVVPVAELHFGCLVEIEAVAEMRA